MAEVARRFRLTIDQAAAADLIRVKEEDSWAYARIYVLLQEYIAGTLSPENLIDEHFDSSTIRSVKPFWHLQREKKNVYTVKMVEVAAWRILTAGSRIDHEVALLGVMHRDQNYESDPFLVERIRRAYEALGFRELGK